MLNLNFNFDGLKHLWEWWPVIKSNLQSIQNAVNAHFSGTDDKHNAQDVNYTGSVPGKANVKEAIDETYERIDYMIEQTDIDPNKDPEVLDARASIIKDKTFATVKARLEEAEQDHITHKAENVQSFADVNARIDDINSKTQLSRILKGLSADSESGHYDTYADEKLYDGIMTLSNTAEGWINSASTVNPWVKMSMPIGVVFPDSIAEGHPNTHGRLHGASGEEDLNKANVVGQISYHLEQYTKLKVYNQGISGNTCAQARARWNADVLASGGTHLPKIPNFVVFTGGINDIVQNRAAADIIADFDWMIDSCVTNNIFPIFFNIGPDTCDTLTTQQKTRLTEVNDWLEDKASETPTMCLIDYYSFMVDPNVAYAPKAGYTTDGLHPTLGTYERIARLIIERAFTDQYPAVIPRYLNFSSACNFDHQPTNVGRPTAILVSVNDTPMQLCLLPNNPDQCVPIPFIKEFINTITVAIVEHEAMFENPGGATYKGWGEIYLSDKNLFAEKQEFFEDDFSYIKRFPIDADAVPNVPIGRAVILSGAVAGNVTYAKAAGVTNAIGTFALTTSTELAGAYVFTGGLCLVQVDGTVYDGDYLVTTGNAGVCTRSATPTAGTIIAQVVKGRIGAGLCLARRR